MRTQSVGTHSLVPRVLYVTDLDGTLLQDDATLSARSRETLVPLLEDGLPLMVASARSVVAMRKILSGVPIKLPVIEFNGAFLSDLATRRHLWVHALDARLAVELFGMIQAAGHTPFLSTFDGERDCLYCASGKNAGMDWYVEDRRAKGDERLRLVAETSAGLNDQVVCFTVIDEDARLRPLVESVRRAWGPRVQIHYQENRYSPGWYWLTVHDCRATKDQAVRQFLNLAQLSGVEIVALGDAENDLGLFAAANHAVAVRNAPLSVRERADEVIGANTEDSVALWLHRDWLARKGVEAAET